MMALTNQVLVILVQTNYRIHNFFVTIVKPLLKKRKTNKKTNTQKQKQTNKQNLFDFSKLKRIMDQKCQNVVWIHNSRTA